MKQLLFNVATDSQSATETLGNEFSKLLKKGDFVAMFGDLGAGKTAFTRGVITALCPDCFVTSPTYTIVNEYITPNFKVFHFDMYRISSPDDLESIGYYDYLDNGVCIAEWCENIEDDIPEEHYEITFRKFSENTERRNIVAYKYTEE